MFVKILAFVKILSQGRRKEGGKFQSLEVRASISHLKSVQLFRVAFFRSDFLQNPYFNGKKTFKIDITRVPLFFQIGIGIFFKSSVFLMKIDLRRRTDLTV